MKNNGSEYDIKITTKSNEEKMQIGNEIHNKLVGNQDYVDSNIILNIDEDNLVRVWISSEVNNIPDFLMNDYKEICEWGFRPGLIAGSFPFAFFVKNTHYIMKGGVYLCLKTN